MISPKTQLKPLAKLKTIKTGKGLQKVVFNLRAIRRQSEKKQEPRRRLSSAQRKVIFGKTGGRCHVCGVELELSDFHADHVKTHRSGGLHMEANFLPSCALCNKYRWHFSSEELQIILKLGVWAKSVVLAEREGFGLEIANLFIKHEMAVRKRKKARNSKVDK